MPAGIAHAPGRVPLKGLVFKLALGKPENKVILVPLVGVFLHPFPDAHSQVILVVVIENIVLFQLGGIKVHISPGYISKTLIQQAGNHVDKLRDAAGSRLDHIRALDIQLVAVRKEGIGIILCNLHHGLVLPLGAFEHLILAGIRIGSQVAHIGDIHDTLDRIPLITQGLLQHILHDVGSQVANVGKMVYRRAAGIHFYHIRRIGGEQFLLVR